MKYSMRTEIGNKGRRCFLQWLGILVLVVGITFLFSSCGDAPAGPEGPEGPEGPVGPAGEDGSMIYAGKGEPGDEIGDIGDYYLNQNTGEFYGPKDEDGWGEAIIVLMGEDGMDGEDGSQIHSGEGAPDSELGSIGDFYFDETSGEFYGPKTEEGWGSPTDLTGEDGQDGNDGEDGSVIHSGEGAPGDNIGAIGDYYLDKSSGEFYGPKTENSWGDPIDLTGEDGEDGQDGEDGSQIHSGSGAPDASLGVVGDYYLDKSSYELYGPKTSNGWGTPLNLKGAEGNANVTRYLFSGHDFSSDSDKYFYLNDLETEEEFRQSAWLGYLFSDPFYYPVPGPGSGGSSEYRFAYQLITSSNEVKFLIDLVDGTGGAYNRVEIIHIGASETVDNRKQKGNAIIPEHLDISDYEEVARYYGF